jgi:hypothetical protein
MEKMLYTELFFNEIAGAAREKRILVRPIMCDIVSLRLRLLAENGA